MKLAKLLNGIETIEMNASPDMEISDVCYDSRRAVKGCLFVAIDGLGEDRHLYIADAVSKGAVCVLCKRVPEIEIPYVIVEDTRSAFASASAVFFENPAEKLKIIGVTGTNGKTSVTHMIKHLLEKLTGRHVGLIGSVYAIIGERELPSTGTTPEPYELHRVFAEMVNAGCEYAVMEVSSHSLSLKRVEGIRFAVGVFTNITQDHLDFYGTMEEYAKAKALLFGLSDKIAINADDETIMELAVKENIAALTFSAKNDGAELVAKQIRLHSDKVDFCALAVGELERTELRVPGMFSVYNGLAAIAALRLLGFELRSAAVALPEFKGVPGRAEVVPTEHDFTVVIDFAHTPDALENIICTIRSGTVGRVVTLFGCGGDRDKTKRPVMGEIAAQLSDYVIVTSDNPRTEEPGAIINDILTGMTGTQTPYTVIENRRDAIFEAIKGAQPGDTIILAGKGHETYQTIGHENYHFDEREIVAEALQSMK